MLREWRQGHRLTLSEVAALAAIPGKPPVSKQAVSKWERGVCMPSDEHCFALARITKGVVTKETMEKVHKAYLKKNPRKSKAVHDSTITEKDGVRHVEN